MFRPKAKVHNKGEEKPMGTYIKTRKAKTA